MSNPFFTIREKCPVCASGRFKTLYQSNYDEPPVRDYLVDFYSSQGMIEFEYLDGAAYVLCECNLCGSIFQKDIPNDILMERLYEHWINPKQALNQQQRQDSLGYFSYLAQEIMQIIAYFKKETSNLYFFDFGMGWAQWALMAKAFGCNSYGTDLSINRIEYAKSNGIKVITWDEIPQHRFDFINTEQVFEHIPEPLVTLRHLKTALKAGGILKISVPTANNINRRLQIMNWKSPKGTNNSLNAVAPLEHINFFRRSSLIRMAREAEMKEVFIPIKLQYRYTTDWGGGIRKLSKNIFRPIFRNLLQNRNYMFFRNI